MVKKIKKNSSYSYNDRDVKPATRSTYERPEAKEFPDVNGENATYGRRLGSYIIDLITYVPVAMLFHFTTLALRQTGGAENERNATYMTIGIVIYALFLFGFVPNNWKGQTLGKRIFNVRTVPTFGTRLDLSKYLVRDFLIKTVIGWVCVPIIAIHYLYKKYIAKEENIVFLHDDLLRTRVVKATTGSKKSEEK